MSDFERVQLSRDRTNPNLPLPTFGKSVRYAIQECGETDDAWMRLEEPGHVRNHARQPDPRHEWGQVGYMILSAAIQGGNLNDYALKSRPVSAWSHERTYVFGHVVLRLAATLMDNHIELTGSAGTSLARAYELWADLCWLEGWHPGELIEETCMAFEAKHANRVTVAASDHLSASPLEAAGWTSDTE